MNRMIMVSSDPLDGTTGARYHFVPVALELAKTWDLVTYAPGQTLDDDSSSRLSSSHVRASAVVHRAASSPLRAARRILSGLRFALGLRRTLRRQPRFDVMYQRYEPLTFVGVVARSASVPLVLELNGFLADELRAAGGKAWVAKAVELVVRAELSLAQAVVVVSGDMRDEVQRRYGVPRDRVSVVGNGTDLAHLEPRSASGARAELGLDPAVAYLVFAGTLQAWQGVTFFLEAVGLLAAEGRDVVALILGEGPMKQQLRDEARSLGLSERVRFEGRIRRERIPIYLAAASVCVAPYVQGHRSPLKVADYLASGRPVVASDIPGVWEMLHHSDAGLTVPPSDGPSLAAAISELLDDPARCARMGESGRAFAARHLRWDQKAMELERRIRRLLGSRGEDGGKRSVA